MSVSCGASPVTTRSCPPPLHVCVCVSVYLCVVLKREPRYYALFWAFLFTLVFIIFAALSLARCGDEVGGILSPPPPRRMDLAENRNYCNYIFLSFCVHDFEKNI